MNSDNQSIELVEPTELYATSFLEMVEEYRQANEKRYWDVSELARRDMAGYVRYLRQRAEGQPGRVTQLTYWLVLGMRVLGASRIRPHLTVGLEAWGGHIAYDIRPSERRKGYGTRLLALTLEKARGLEMPRAVLMCYRSNIGSAKVMESNGARLVSQGYNEAAQGEIYTYVIEL